jgi:hypothetical protein
VRRLNTSFKDRLLVVLRDGDAQRESDALTRQLKARHSDSVSQVILPTGRDPGSNTRGALGSDPHRGRCILPDVAKQLLGLKKANTPRYGSPIYCCRHEKKKPCCIYTYMAYQVDAFYLLGDVARKLRCPPHRITYAARESKGVH